MASAEELFDKIGGFDEDYFMYYEDVDFRVAPYSSRPDAPYWLRQEVRRSQVAYFQKHRPTWESSAMRAINKAYFAAHGWQWW